MPLPQILTGLNAGQQVVTTGAASLDDGTHVKVVASLEGSDKSEEKPDAAKGSDDK